MTVKDIAGMAGVSIGTVDRVINGRPGVSQATRERIEGIIAETGYRPNAYASNLRHGRQVHAGVLLPAPESEFGYWKLVADGVGKAADELSGFGLDVECVPYDRDVPGSFTKGLAMLSERGCNAFLIAPLPAAEAAAIGDAISGKPTIFIDTVCLDHRDVPVMAQNPFKGGAAAGRVMRLLCGDGGTFITLQIHPDAYNSYERARGFSSYMRRDSASRTVNIDIRDISEIPKVLDSAFQSYDGIRGIFSVNCIICRVGDYLVQHHLKERVAAVGYDLVEANRAALVNGSVDAIISQRPGFQGYTALSRLFRSAAYDEPLSSMDEVPIDIFFRENLTESIE